MNKLALSLSLASFVVAFARVASADELPPTPQAPPPASPDATDSRSDWYGYQTLIADGVAGAGLVLTATVGGSSRSEAAAPSLLVGTLASYALGAPIVHFANGEAGRGLASFAVRLAAPSVGAGLGFAAASGCSRNGEAMNFCPLGGLVVGVGVGMAVASVVDASALAWKPAKKTEEKASIAPDLSITPQGATIGATGRF